MPVHLGTLQIPIQNLKCPKNAKNACADITLLPSGRQVMVPICPSQEKLGPYFNARGSLFGTSSFNGLSIWPSSIKTEVLDKAPIRIDDAPSPAQNGENAPPKMVLNLAHCPVKNSN